MMRRSLLIAVMMFSVSSALAVPTPPDVAGSPPHKGGNPHLHLPSPTPSPKGKRPPQPEHRHHHHHDHWSHHWSYSDWVHTHRGTGMIRGYVRNRDGSPAVAVHLALRTSKGKSFRNSGMKHLTMTNNAGEFVMAGVRVGRYRVRVTKGKASNHADAAVSSGSTSHVSIQI